MPPKNKRFMLVRWLVDETVGVMPLTSVKKDHTPRVGAYVEAKYQGKFYEAEILKISGESRTRTRTNSLIALRARACSLALHF